MPSPASHLRAPLLWLLFPFMAGLTAAQLWPAPRGFLVPLALLATALSVIAVWLASHAGCRQRACARVGARTSSLPTSEGETSELLNPAIFREGVLLKCRSGFTPDTLEKDVGDKPRPTTEFREPTTGASVESEAPTGLNPGENHEAAQKFWSEIGWALCLCVASGLGGFVLLHYREPQLHHWETQPPREITVTVLIQQLYPGAPHARSVSGLGKIVSAAASDRDLINRRIYFSALKKISVPPQRSGRYELRGIIEPLPREPTEASFNDFLANLGIRQKITRGRLIREVIPPGRFEQFCNRTEDRLEKILSHGLEHHPEVSSLYLAMLLGEKAVLSPDQQNAFMRSGTFHIFSISGLHVGVIAVALQSVLQLLQVPRKTTAGLTLVILWLYLEVTGINAPAVRSFLMIAFMLGAKIFRLPGNALAALAAAALLTLLLEPMQLFSTGFQMSFSIVTALVVMGVPLTEKILARWLPFSALPKPFWRWYHRRIDWCGRWLLGSLAAGGVAFLASVPSGIGYFRLFSPGSLLANLIVIPLSSLAIIAGFISLLTGLLSVLSLSALFNAAAALTIIAMDWLAQHGTRLPGVYFEAHFVQAWMVPAAIVAMLAIMFAGLAGRWSWRYGGYLPPVVLLALIVIFGVKFD